MMFVCLEVLAACLFWNLEGGTWSRASSLFVPVKYCRLSSPALSEQSFIATSVRYKSHGSSQSKSQPAPAPINSCTTTPAHHCNMFPQSRESFCTSLEQRGLRLEFGGYLFWSWTCVQLRNLVRLFDKRATFRRGHTKIDLCDQLLRTKLDAISADEQRQVELIGGFEIDDWHRDETAAFLLNRAARNNISVDQQAPVGRSATKRSAPDDSNPEPPVKRERLNGDEDTAITARDASSTNITTQQCEICMEDIVSIDFLDVPFGTSCEHQEVTTCRACMTLHIEHQAHYFKLDNIQCPEPYCTATLSSAQMHQHASPTMLTRYNDMLLMNYLEQNPEYFRCSNPACLSGQLVDLEFTSTYITCHDCKAHTCITCDTVWHPDISHDDNTANIKREATEQLARATEQERQDRQRRVQEEAASELAKEESDTQCSKCKHHIEKTDGCDHMRCKSLPRVSIPSSFRIVSWAIN